MYELDVTMTHAIDSVAGSIVPIALVTIWVSIIGVPLLVLAVAGRGWRRGDREHTRHVLVAAGLSFLLGLALSQLVLLFVHRMRPHDAGITHRLLAPSVDLVIPSDHATAAFAIAAAFLLHRMRRLGFWFLAAGALVMIPRVYVGTHFVSDVLGGALIGTIAAMAVRAFYREGTRADRRITDIL
ncbi:MAG: phosphatase PAP2 family protein [Rhizobiales bacterium 65-79]|nr:phosphatase PAP2 family protein [Hyphomicrobiales bacterium]OJU04820.1 MAG: phosphatase PAP2 family protein [Rhizobiales bacterium 65-79]